MCLALIANSVCLGQEAKKENLCLNPGFELLNPAGDNFPLNWSRSAEPFGEASATIDKKAHGGSISVRMIASAKGVARLNSDLIPIIKGKVEFYYKAIKATLGGDNLRLYVIGMNKKSVEVTRAAWTVPVKYIGDGKWHLGELEFDFTAYTAVAAVVAAPRVNENSISAEGDWLIDDFECLGSLGSKAEPRPEIEALYMPDHVLQSGKIALLVVQIRNSGRGQIGESKIRLVLPEGVTISGKSAAEEVRVDTLDPGQWCRLTWDLIAKSPGEMDLRVEWQGQGFKLDKARHIVCVDKINLRELCTRSDGFWRLMPKLQLIQGNNSAPLMPLKTIKSVDLPESYIGVTAHLPRTRDFEVIFEPEYLIDGDNNTSWSGRAHATTVPGAVDWVQINLPSAQEVKQIKLIPYWHGEGFPVDFVVKLRRNNIWKTVYEGVDVQPPAQYANGDKRAFPIEIAPIAKADAVRIEVTRFSGAHGFFTDCCPTYYFRLSEMEVINDQGKNVALRSNGAKADMSWTFRSYFNSTKVVRDTYHELYNLGVKWNRVGQWGDWICWAMVEQKKGVYYIDPTTDIAITESVRNGVNILYTLDYGNPLYEKTTPLYDPGPLWKHGHPFSGDGGPTTPEAILGFVNYAKFVANHFKGSVKYYEIWNEENSWAWYGSPPDPKAFGTLIRETGKALKEIDPEIKIVVGGTAALAPTFISQALEQGGGKYIDYIAFHPYTMPYPEMGLGSLDIIDGTQLGKTKEELGYTTYAEMLQFYRKTFSQFNPNIKFWADEWNAIPTREDSPYKSISEIEEAKQCARFFLVNTLLGVRATWWSLANENTIYDWGILRTGDLSRKPVYYTLQAMTTLLSGAYADSSVHVDVTGDVPELRCETLRGRDGELLIAIWSAINPLEDDYQGKRVSLSMKASQVTSIEAIDTFHALTQKVDFLLQKSNIVMDGLLVMDYPIIIRIR